ncbi:MAG: PAS domain S-box protein [Desulfococcaceae bacterium]
MKLRAILSVLAALALFSALLGAGVYYVSVQETQAQSARRRVESRAESVRLRIDSVIAGHLDAAEALAGLPAIRRALASGDASALAEANAVLDTFAAALHADVCYLMNREGTTLAASNRERADSFVGQVYEFRPYFRRAVRGDPSAYMALGVTSGRRGLYFGQPVSDDGEVLGVAVVKIPAERMEEEADPDTGVWLLIDPNGLIFSGNRSDWHLRFLWPAGIEARRALSASRQFGVGPWADAGLRRESPGVAADPRNRRYRFHSIPLNRPTGWRVVYLSPKTDDGLLPRWDQLTVGSGGLALLFLFLVALSVLVLYRQASREINRRRDAESALFESERRYRSVFENTGTGTVLSEADMTLSMVNAEFARMTGYDRSEIEGKLPWTAFIHPEDHDRMRDYHYRRRRGEPNVPTQWECRLLDRAGNIHQVVVQAGLIPGTSTSVSSFIDVTEHRRAEAAFRESEERYRQFFESDFSGAYISSPRGKLLACNPAFARIFGHETPEQALSVDLRELYCRTADRVSFLDRLRRDGRVADHETEMIRRDGAIIQTVENAVGVFDPDGRLAEIRGYLLDVTEKKNLEAQLRQALKMEAVGTLAGGVAHDFNNLLMAIQGSTDLMLRELSPDHPHAEKLSHIASYVRSGARLTAQLLGFARKGRFEPSPMDLHRLVSETSETVGRTRKDVTVELDLVAKKSAIEADRGQIEQLLLNLMINALDAMPDGGRLTLATRNLSPAEIGGRIRECRADSYLRLDVTDTGVGMDQRTLDQVFDPFFTTKTLGRGTGLGLASAFGIVQNHDGHIEVSSVPDQGTTFRVFFPNTALPVAAPSPPPVVDLTEQEGAVLLVDDEPMVRDVGAEMLATLGFDVVTAASGAEAIDRFRERGDTIRLVILDMIMPEMSGERVFEQLRSMDPSVRVLLSSGYSLEGQARAILARGCDGFIQKPFNLREISGKIREVLAGGPPPSSP